MRAQGLRRALLPLLLGAAPLAQAGACSSSPPGAADASAPDPSPDAQRAPIAPDGSVPLEAASEAGPDAPAPRPDAALDARADADGGAVVVPPSAFRAGALAGLPARAELLPLPGGGVGEPVLTSNNPELFTGDGTLYTNARALPTRGGAPVRLPRVDGGHFGVYLHHLNRAGRARYVSVLVTNPGAAPVAVTLDGAGYTQGETGGVGLGSSPDYRVSRDQVTGASPARALASVQPLAGEVLFARRVEDGHEIDGRFTITASSAVNVYVVVAADASATAALAVTQPITEAPGDYRASGRPPPPFGREAGVYAHDTWRGELDVELPAGPGHAAFMVNTATGGGLAPVQAFPALAHLDESAAEAVGMYGNVYDLDIGLVSRAIGPRRVRVSFHSLATGAASRWWDGAALVDGALVDVRHVPASPTTTLFEGDITPGTRRVTFRAMVPGLTAIPQAISVEALD